MSWSSAVSRAQDLNPRLYTKNNSTRVYTPVNRTRLYNTSRPSAVRHERRSALPAYSNVSSNAHSTVSYGGTYDTIREQAALGNAESARTLTNIALSFS